jgi:MFS family permease
VMAARSYRALFAADAATTALFGVILWVALPETRRAGDLPQANAIRGSALVADLAPTDLRGRYQGAFAIAFTGAFASAPPVGGYALAHAGAYWLWIGCLVTGLAVAAGFLMLRRVTPTIPGGMIEPT